MNFSTPVELPSDLPRFTQADELLLMGSCFATNIGALAVTFVVYCCLIVGSDSFQDRRK